METVELSRRLGEVLLSKGLTISTAESCTSGGVASAIASIDGASSWFIGGIVSYSVELKQSLLGVSPETIAKYGVVSRETVIEMARGVIERTGSDCAISISGYAGANGGDNFAPNGTIWLCFSMPDNQFVTRKITVSGNRISNLQSAVQEALSLAFSCLKQ